MGNHLPAGYKLQFHNHPGEYTILKVMGKGASTIAYLTSYKNGAGLCSERILKEYCPCNIPVDRGTDGVLTCDEKYHIEFERGKECFVAGGARQNEIRALTRLQNETPPLQELFKKNNTVYLEVTPYAGKTYDRLTDLTLLQKMNICLALAKLVRQYHAEGYLCLDIKPENIFVLTNSSDEIVTDLIELIDFDSVRKKTEISFGNSLSFTAVWAAPEQNCPHGAQCICEATDIYAIGELVFWSIFGRHSLPEEHRDFSLYPFNDAKIQFSSILARRSVKKILTNLFRKTLRSSVRNRFSSATDVVTLLEQLIAEIGKKEYVLESKVNQKSFFIGRQKELADIKLALQTDNIVFVAGIAGIGKSEIVKRYISLHKDEYDSILYWTYEGNIDSMVSRDVSVGISNFTRLDEETDSQYARRKLEKLRELLDGQNNLIVVDNMDRSIDELAQQETWELLNNLPGKLLISTRVKESLLKTIEILPLPDIEESLCLFREYCAFGDENIADVTQIIESVNRHTLLIELLAHHTKATHSTPKQTLEKLQNHGICGLSTETVRLLKDGKVESNSVFSHVEKIFSMEAMSEEQILVLAMCALMPVGGVQTTKFASFYSLDNYNDINWLISRGWIYVGSDESELITLHPTIASVVIEHLKANEHLLKQLYSKCYDAMGHWDSKKLKDSERVLYADTLALSTTDRFSIKSRCAAIFIEQYVGMYSKHGNAEQKMRQIDFAIGVLRQYISENKYSAILEQCHYQKANKLCVLRQYEHAISLCKEHLKKATAAKDTYFAAKWCILLAGIYNSYDHQSNSFSNQLNYYFRGIYYAYKIERDVSRKKPHFLESEHLINDLDYDYMERSKNRFHINLMLDFANWMENQSAMVLYCSKGNRMEISNLTRATSMRERITKDTKLRYTNNSFEIFIDKARIAFLSGKYQEAGSLLRELVDYCTKRNLVDTSTMYRVHQFLAQIALRQRPSDYAQAIEEFENCLKISENLSSHNTYMVRLELGFIYVVCGEIEKAEKLNTELWCESRSLAPEIRKTYYADALRNKGYLHYLQGDHYIACNMLRRALEEYDKANAPIDMVWFGKARTYRLLAEWYYSNNCDPSEVNIKTAIERLTTAVDMYKSSVGLEHPEAEASRNRLTEISKQL